MVGADLERGAGCRGRGGQEVKVGLGQRPRAIAGGGNRDDGIQNRDLGKGNTTRTMPCGGDLGLGHRDRFPGDTRTRFWDRRRDAVRDRTPMRLTCPAIVRRRVTVATAKFTKAAAPWHRTDTIGCGCGCGGRLGDGRSAALVRFMPSRSARVPVAPAAELPRAVVAIRGGMTASWNGAHGARGAVQCRWRRHGGIIPHRGEIAAPFCGGIMGECRGKSAASMWGKEVGK